MGRAIERYREYVRDSMRRRHNYQPFVSRFLQLLNEHNLIDKENEAEPKNKTRKLVKGKRK